MLLLLLLFGHIFVEHNNGKQHCYGHKTLSKPITFYPHEATILFHTHFHAHIRLALPLPPSPHHHSLTHTHITHFHRKHSPHFMYHRSYSFQFRIERKPLFKVLNIAIQFKPRFHSIWPHASPPFRSLTPTLTLWLYVAYSHF